MARHYNEVYPLRTFATCLPHFHPGETGDGMDANTFINTHHLRDGDLIACSIGGSVPTSGINTGTVHAGPIDWKAAIAPFVGDKSAGAIKDVASLLRQSRLEKTVAEQHARTDLRDAMGRDPDYYQCFQAPAGQTSTQASL